MIGLKSCSGQPTESSGEDSSDRIACFPVFSFPVEMPMAAVSEVIFYLNSAEFRG